MAKDERKSGGVLTAIVAGIFGAAAGAAAVFFSNKSNRDNVEKSMDSLVKKGKKEAAKLHESLDDLSADAREKLARELEKTSKKLSK